VTRIVEALSRQDGPALLAEVRELDRDVPDYDRALTELAAFLQRIAIVQIVPEAAEQDEEFDAEALARLARTIPPEDVQLYYQIALGGRRDLAMAPEPRIGFEMSLLRMLAFRPEAAAAESGAGASSPAAAGPRAATAAAGASASPTKQASAAGAPMAANSAVKLTTIDAANWAAVVDCINVTGMVRQFALNCVPAAFANSVLRLQFDQAAAHRRTPQIEEKLVQGLSAYLGADVRVVFESSESALVTPARRRATAEQDKFARAAVAFEDDAAVKGLQERFGAQTDPESVKPTN
jgi:DNA polymerase-3 subunit gamma/tau